MRNRVEKIVSYPVKGNVLYLMCRDHRIKDNYSIDLCYNLSYDQKSSFFIGIDLSATKRNRIQDVFYEEGLECLKKESLEYNIHMIIIKDLEGFIKKFKISCIVTEFNPLRKSLDYQENIKEICHKLKIAFYICDSHNVVPAKELEVYVKTYSAVRKRLESKLHEYLLEFNDVEKHKYNQPSDIAFKDQCLQEVTTHAKKHNHTSFQGGHDKGIEVLNVFLKGNIRTYKNYRNNPSIDGPSNLSSWIHFGYIGVQRIMLEARKKCDPYDENYEVFIAELIWKSTAEHYCLYEKNYDNIEGALPWAKGTLMDHKSDKREKLYSLEQLRRAETSDEEWNAGQKEVVITGKMHGHVRMYWAKKILYWFKTPEEAIEAAIYLNDEYSIDGNDPNGYLSVMWSICGVMDRGWGEREICGKIRSMNGIKSKSYVEKWNKHTLTDENVFGK